MAAQQKTMLVFLFALLAVSIAFLPSAHADDQAVLGSSGDSQTCLDGDLSCAGLDGTAVRSMTQDSALNLSGGVSLIRDVYTTNELVLMNNSALASSIQNNGLSSVAGGISVVVERNSSREFSIVDVLVNDTSYNTTILPSESLDLSQMYNPMAWNTTLAGAGSYRMHVIFSNGTSTIFESYAPFAVSDYLVFCSILSPSGSVFPNTSISLQFSAASYRNLGSCSFYQDGSLLYAMLGPAQGVNSVQLSGLNAKTINISMECSDVEGHNSSQQSIMATIVAYSKFGGNSTDLSSANLSNITNLVLEAPSVGKIHFLQEVNLSGGADLNQYVVIAPKSISVDSAALVALNKSAVLTFYDVSDITHPVIFRDSKVCSECSIDSFSGGVLTMTVSHFSSYTIGTNSKLEAKDTSDSGSRATGEIIQIIGNYTNVTSSAEITGASCSVMFDDMASQPMAYDAGLGAYTYSRTYSSTGVFFYNISCSASGFEALNVSDFVSIGVIGGPVSPTNITVGETSSGSVHSDPQSVDSVGGNTTEVSITSIRTTRTWQGVYGNLSGSVILSDSNKQTFYNWSLDHMSGEIYASRAAGVDFSTLGCGEQGTVDAEDSYLGSAGAVDAVNNTFVQKNHPSFSTGSVGFTQNSCPSVNLRTATGIDSSKYYQLLLVDGSNHTVYTSILQPKTLGFNNKSNDFQMLVPTKQDTIEQYFYWAEIN